MLIGIVATIPLGVLFGLPAVRTRGINLAIVTLGLGSAVELVLFGNTDYTGGFGGTQIGEPVLFGLNINSASHPTRYGLVASAALIVAGLIVANLRRGRSGRRLIAVRTNERAAAALGISVPGPSSTPSRGGGDRRPRRHPARLPHAPRSTSPNSAPSTRSRWSPTR